MKAVVGEEEQAYPSRLRKVRARRHSPPEGQRGMSRQMLVLGPFSLLLRSSLQGDFSSIPTEFEGRSDFSKAS